MKRKIFCVLFIFMLLGLCNASWAPLPTEDPLNQSSEEQPTKIKLNKNDNQPSNLRESINHPMIDHLNNNQELSSTSPLESTPQPSNSKNQLIITW